MNIFHHNPAWSQKHYDFWAVECNKQLGWKNSMGLNLEYRVNDDRDRKNGVLEIVHVGGHTNNHIQHQINDILKNRKNKNKEKK